MLLILDHTLKTLQYTLKNWILSLPPHTQHCIAAVLNPSYTFESSEEDDQNEKLPRSGPHVRQITSGCLEVVSGYKLFFKTIQEILMGS